jgi:hypothetical protein
MQTMIARCCWLDVHKARLTASGPLPGPNGSIIRTRFVG